MSNECQSLNFCNSTLSGLIIIKAKALSYSLFRLPAEQVLWQAGISCFEFRIDSRSLKY
jgi:hypothetical protein